MNIQFDARVRLQPGSVVIDLQGEIDATAELGLNQAYAEAERLDQPNIVLNFQKVDYINSTGIALIVGLLAQARKRHRKLVVFGLSDHYQEIFQITRLADFMQMYPDEASALTDLAAIH
jgi:anti-sigma B factor antagonist